jgi:hypothetical protein
MNNAKYFAVLIVALVVGLWINILHHVQISNEWQNAGIKFAEVKAKLEHLERDCIKAQ